MSFRSIAAAAGALRNPALEWYEDGRYTIFIVDSGESPERVALHDLGHTRKKCEGDECQLCVVGVRLRVSWVATVEVMSSETEGVMSSRALWLSRRELGDLAAVLPETGTVWVQARREPDPNGKTNPKTGEPWTVKEFKIFEEYAADLE
jgi:hypothetical protein